LLAFVTLICSASFGQKLTYGIGFDYGRLFNQTGFNAIPSIARPPLPLTGQAPLLNYLISGNLNYYLTDWLKFGIRIDWSEPVFKYRDLETTLIGREGNPEEAIIEHTLQAKLSQLGGEPILGFVLPEVLSVNFGFKFAYNYNTNLTQTQKIIQPSDYIITKPVGNYSGNIPNASKVLYLPSVRLESETSILKMKNLMLKPEIQFQIVLNNLVSGITWKYSNLSAGISISYVPEKRVLMPVDSVLFIKKEEKTVLAKPEEPAKIIQLSSNPDTAKNTSIPDSNPTVQNSPKAKPMLLGELSTMFFIDGKIESKEFSITYQKTTTQWILPVFSEKEGTPKFTGKIIKKTDTISHTVIPDLKFYPKVTAEAGLKKWEIVLYSDSEVISRLDGELDIPQNILWGTGKYFSHTDLTGKIINFKFNLEDYENNKVTASTGLINFTKSAKPGFISNRKMQVIIIPSDVAKFKIFTNFLIKNPNKKSVKIYYSRINQAIIRNTALENELHKYGEIEEKNLKELFPALKFQLPPYNYFVIIIE